MVYQTATANAELCSRCAQSFQMAMSCRKYSASAMCHFYYYYNVESNVSSQSSSDPFTHPSWAVHKKFHMQLQKQIKQEKEKEML